MPITPITITTSGADGAVTLTAQNVPPGLTFTDNGNGTGDITGDLAAGTAAGSPYAVTIDASDAGGNTDSEVVNIVVNPAPRSPYDVGVADPASPLQQVTNWLPAGWTTISCARVVGPDLVCMVNSTTSGTSEFALVDISNPATPSVVSTFGPITHNGTTGYVKSNTDANVIADFANQRMYIFGQGGRAAYDISDPANPALLAGSNTPIIGHDDEGIGFNGTYLVGNESSNIISFVDPVTMAKQAGAAVNGLAWGECSSDYFIGVDGNRKVVVYALNGGTNLSYVLDTLAPGSSLYVYQKLLWLGNYAGGQQVFALTGRDQFDDDMVRLHTFEIVGNEGTADLAPADVHSGTTSTGNVIAAANVGYNHQITADTNGIVYSQWDTALIVYDCSDYLNVARSAVLTKAASTCAGISVTNGKVVDAYAIGLTIYT